MAAIYAPGSHSIMLFAALSIAHCWPREYNFS
ncbi:protein of unknown function [Burkholderia multivorans]